ncbi:MAG: AAA family ATPase [Thiobacillaceae bacterium]
MYLEFFGLKDAPFRITPDTNFWFPGGQRGEILDALIYAVRHGEGLIKVVGEVGSGKTMVLRMLLNHLPDKVDSLYLANPTLSPDEILAALLADLGAGPLISASRQAMLDHLNKLLLEKHQQGRRSVIFVEEAQAMPFESLEFLRLLTNLETARDKLLQIILFGQPELDELLANPRIRQLKDRITLSLRLGPLPSEAIPAYLQSRLATAGYRGPDLFDARTARAITRYSGGLTRRINILADKTLLAAYVDQTHNLRRSHVHAAANDAELAATAMKGKINWGWVTAGITSGLGLIAFLFWLGLGEITPAAHAQVPLPAVPAAEFASAPSPRTTAPDSATANFIKQPRLWLEQADPATFVIQIYTTKDEAEASVLLGALSKQAIPQPLRVFPVLTYRGEAWIVVAGEFSERALAQAALSTLPEALKAQGPLLRSVGKIRETLSTSVQKAAS